MIMYRSLCSIVILTTMLFPISFSRTDITNGYAKFEKQIAPKNAVRDYYKKNVHSVRDIPSFVKYMRSQGFKTPKVYRFEFLRLVDFGKHVTATNFLNSIEYKYALQYINPKCTAYGSEYGFHIKINYADSKVFQYKFPLACKYKRRTTKVEDLGFFEVFGTGGTAESKNVTYDVYRCKLGKSDISKVKRLEKGLHTRVFSKVLADAPWDKYVVVGKTYNKATYRPSNVTYDGSTQKESSGGSSKSVRKRASSGVKEVYVGSTTSQGKQYVIRCRNGRSTNSVHLKGNGYWYSSTSNMGDGYRNLSINSLADKYCR